MTSPHAPHARESRVMSRADRLNFDVERSADGRFLLQDRIVRSGYWMTLEELEERLQEFA